MGFLMNILKSIQIFQQVVEDKSFTRAADNMNLVPSAVSRQISELENWLGVRLINRTTRSLHLTDDGQRYLEKMNAITRQVDDLKASKENQYKLSGRVKITTPMMLGQRVVPDMLSAFKAQYPDVKLSLSLMNRKVDLIEEGYDIAIRAGNLSDSSFYARKIGHTAFKTVASRDYLQSRPPLNEPSDLSQHNCIVNTAISSSKRWQYQVNGVSKYIKVDGDIEVNESACILAFAKAGLGVAMLPALYVEDDIQSGQLIEVLSEFALDPLPINILFPSNKLQSLTVRTLVDYLTLNFKKC